MGHISSRSYLEGSNIPAIPLNSSSTMAPTEHQLPLSGNNPAMVGPPSPLPMPSATFNASMDNQFILDAPETQVGRKWKTCDLHFMLVVCMCGQAVSENKIL